MVWIGSLPANLSGLRRRPSECACVDQQRGLASAGKRFSVARTDARFFDRPELGNSADDSLAAFVFCVGPYSRQQGQGERT